MERLEQFVLNRLTYVNEHPKVVFLTLVEKKNLNLLMDLSARLKLPEKKLLVLIDLLHAHFVPKTNFIAKRYESFTPESRNIQKFEKIQKDLDPESNSLIFLRFLNTDLKD